MIVDPAHLPGIVIKQIFVDDPHARGFTYRGDFFSHDPSAGGDGSHAPAQVMRVIGSPALTESAQQLTLTPSHCWRAGKPAL